MKSLKAKEQRADRRTTVSFLNLVFLTNSIFFAVLWIFSGVSLFGWLVPLFLWLTLMGGLYYRWVEIQEKRTKDAAKHEERS